MFVTGEVRGDTFYPWCGYWQVKDDGGDWAVRDGDGDDTDDQSGDVCLIFCQTLFILDISSFYLTWLPDM